MKHMDYKEALDMLHRAGFTTWQIDRLTRLRRGRTANELDRSPADLRRLEFVRWLVVTRRLTDQII